MCIFTNLLFIVFSDQKCQRTTVESFCRRKQMINEFFKNRSGILTRKAAKSITIFSFLLVCLSRLWFLDQDNTIKKAKNLDDLLRVGNTLPKLSHRTVSLYLEYCNIKANFFSDKTCNQNSLRIFWNFHCILLFRQEIDICQAERNFFCRVKSRLSNEKKRGR